MTIEIGLSIDEINTQYAPLAALLGQYQANRTLESLAAMDMAMKTRDFSPGDKLIQTLMSILAGCETLSEVNVKLESETHLAMIWEWPRWADQSTLSRTLDALTQKQIDQLRQSVTTIWRTHSQARRHDWRSYLWLDFDLSGLPCAAQAQESQKGYFGEKKRHGAPVGAG